MLTLFKNIKKASGGCYVSREGKRGQRAGVGPGGPVNNSKNNMRLPEAGEQHDVTSI